MIIGDLSLGKERGWVRARATIEWEDSERAPQELFFEVGEEHAELVSCDPHSFLVGAFVPALHFGERRIRLDEKICPRLKGGLEIVAAYLNHWYAKGGRAVAIEAPVLRGYPDAPGRAAGGFLSGGIDSLAMLRANRLQYEKGHPEYIDRCLFVYGFDMGGSRTQLGQEETYELVARCVEEVADDAECGLVRVFTNVRLLCDDLTVWLKEFHGAALASVAHFFSRAFHTVTIASSADIPNLQPLGSHPLLDPNYSSYPLRIAHEGVLRNKVMKARLISGWDAALRNLRVCTANVEGKVNCSACEKCLRTMLTLEAIGALDRCATFEHDRVPVELFANIEYKFYLDTWYYGHLASLLRERGRKDLYLEIRKLILKYRLSDSWRALRIRASGLDRRLTGGKARALKGRLFNGT